MAQQSADAFGKAVLFANGLRRNVVAAGRQWARWPTGAADLAAVTACIDGIKQRLKPSTNPEEDQANLAAGLADLRAVLEWTTYQAGSISTARALFFARKVRAFADRFGIYDDGSIGLSDLEESERSLIASVETRNGFMIALADRNPHLGLPRPLVDLASLAPKKKKKPPGKLALIQRLRKSMKDKPG